jgi:hypothetical protein
VDIAINHLKVGQSPKIEQSRPSRVSSFAPHPKERDAMVHFGVPPQTRAALSAAPTLDAPQKSDVATWGIPELPRDHAGAVPDRVLVGAATPKVNVPTEAINWLAAHATKSRAQGVRGFTERCRWGAERERQAAPAVAEPPTPTVGRLAASCKCSRQAIGTNWMGAQYDSIASRGVGGTKGRARARVSTARGNTRGNALVRRTSDRRFLSAFSSCQPEIVRPPAVRAS